MAKTFPKKPKQQKRQEKRKNPFQVKAQPQIRAPPAAKNEPSQKPKQQKRREKKKKPVQVKAQPQIQAPPVAKNEPQISQSRIRILSWKTDLEGAALGEKLVQNNADIALLQGTNLASLEALPDGYKLFHKPGNNVAIVMRENIPAEEIGQSEGQEQVQSLLIKLEKEFVLTNVTMSPPSFDPKLLSGIHEKHLIGGDFEALHKDWNCETTNEAGEMIQRFKADHMYKMVPSALWSNKTEVELQKHNFFLISPRLMPDFLTWRNRLMTEDEGSPLLLTWTVTPRNGVPLKRIFNEGEKRLRKQLRKRFRRVWNAGTRERPPFPTNIFIPEDLRDSCMEFWERLCKENVKHLGRKLRKMIRGQFLKLWRAQPSLELPVFPQEIKVPVDGLDNCLEFWEGLWKKYVGKRQRRSTKMQNRRARRRLAQKQPKTTESVAALSSGIVTHVLSKCGYLFAKEYGKVYIPLKAVMRPTSNDSDMQLYLVPGDSVKFSAVPQAATNNCQWAATHVEAEPETDMQPDILRDKTGVVDKIADNGSYAFIKSEEHGRVPGSACISQGEGKRLDEVFQVGDKVKFAAHVQPETTGGVGWKAWKAVTATKIEQEHSVAPMAWPRGLLQKEDETSITGWACKRPRQSQQDSTAPPPKTARQAQEIRSLDCEW